MPIIIDIDNSLFISYNNYIFKKIVRKGENEYEIEIEIEILRRQNTS